MNAPANVERQAIDEPYVIRKGASFYKPNFAGYTSHIEAAGIYSKEQALAVAEDRRNYAGATPPHEISAQPLSDFAQEIEESSRLLAEKRAALGMAPLHSMDMMADDGDLRRIANRHDQDAPWFDCGLHDPSGYVVVAHKDRGALLERLRALRTGEKAAPSPAEFRKWLSDNGHAEMLISVDPPRLIINPTVAVPKAAYDWLMGEGPDDNGLHFGESEDAAPDFRGKKPICWWRTTFRRMCGR